MASRPPIRQAMPRLNSTKRWAGRSNPGFYLVELLISTTLLAVVVVSAAKLWSKQFSIGTRSVSLDGIDGAVSIDLNWIRGYAKYWELGAGPYNLTYDDTGAPYADFGAAASTSPIVTSSLLVYSPSATDCDANTLPQSFIAMAAGASTATIGDATNPIVRPNPIPTVSGQAQTIALPSSVQGYILTRTINFSGLTNRIRVVYSLSDDTVSPPPVSAASLPSYPREASILLEAAPWCAN